MANYAWWVVGAFWCLGIGCLKLLERNKATIPPARYADRFNRVFKAKFVGHGAPYEPSYCSDTALAVPSTEVVPVVKLGDIEADFGILDSPAQIPSTESVQSGGTSELTGGHGAGNAEAGKDRGSSGSIASYRRTSSGSQERYGCFSVSLTILSVVWPLAAFRCP